MSRVNASPAGHTGLIDNAIGVVSALFAYVETRAALLAVESRRCCCSWLVLLRSVWARSSQGVFGYIFLVASLIVGIAHGTGFSWTWIALATGVLHILVAGVCVFLAKSKLRGRLYPETRSELKRDQTWLKTLGKTEQQ